MLLLNFFDSNICYDPEDVFMPGGAAGLDRTLDYMRRCGIESGLVCSTLRQEYHPSYANGRLMEDIAPHCCLQPVWAVLPHHTGEFPEP